MKDSKASSRVTPHQPLIDQGATREELVAESGLPRGLWHQLETDGPGWFLEKGTRNHLRCRGTINHSHCTQRPSGGLLPVPVHCKFNWYWNNLPPDSICKVPGKFPALSLWSPDDHRGTLQSLGWLIRFPLAWRVNFLLWLPCS